MCDFIYCGCRNDIDIILPSLQRYIFASFLKEIRQKVVIFSQLLEKWRRWQQLSCHIHLISLWLLCAAGKKHTGRLHNLCSLKGPLKSSITAITFCLQLVSPKNFDLLWITALPSRGIVAHLCKAGREKDTFCS